MDTATDEMLELRSAVQATNVRFILTYAIGPGRIAREGVQIEYRPFGSSKWRKHRHAIFPVGDQTLADVLAMLGQIREGLA
jgi:hypothetical protein